MSETTDEFDRVANLVHVLKQEIARLRDLNDDNLKTCLAEIDRLVAERDKLIEALRYYADDGAHSGSIARAAISKVTK